MAYTLPIASSDTLGGIMVGDKLTISQDGVLDVDLSEIESTIQQSANDLKQGKQAIASSLTNKGSPSTADETLLALAEKILDLNTDMIGTASMPRTAPLLKDSMKADINIVNFNLIEPTSYRAGLVNIQATDNYSKVNE